MATIALIPGAWITPAMYQTFIGALTVTGHPVLLAEHPSLDPVDPTKTDCKRDADIQAEVIQSLVEDEERDVLLVMHSYGGMSGAAAAWGLSKSERMRQNKPGGIIGMVFIAAFIVPEDVSCAGMQGGIGSLPPWILQDQPLPDLCLADNPVSTFAADCDEELVRDLPAQIRPHSMTAFTSPQPAPAWADAAYTGRLAAVITLADQAVPQEAQRAMLAATQKEWIVKEMACSHCAPFLARIDNCVELILGFLGTFESLNT